MARALDRLRLAVKVAVYEISKRHPSILVRIDGLSSVIHAIEKRKPVRGREKSCTATCNISLDIAL